MEAAVKTSANEERPNKEFNGRCYPVVPLNALYGLDGARRRCMHRLPSELNLSGSCRARHYLRPVIESGT